MKISKKILILIVIIISIISLSTIANATSLSDFENFFKSKHVVCGETYELGSKEKEKISEIIRNSSITNDNAKETLNNLEEAISILNATNATNLCNVDLEIQSKAVTLFQSAGSKVGLDVKINTESSTVTIIKTSDKTVLATVQYIIDSTGNITISSVSFPTTTNGQTKSNTYKTIEGSKQEYNINSGKNIEFRFDADYSLFKNGGKVLIDNTVLDTKNYTSKSGSTVISLNADYAKTLAVGNHTIKVEYNNGNSSSETFAVLDKTVNTNTTKTTNTTNTTNTKTTNTTNTTNTVQNNNSTTNTINSNTNTAFAYTGESNVTFVVLLFIAVVAVSTAFIKKVYDK